MPRALAGGVPKAEALGRSRGGLTTKMHLRSDGLGAFLTGLLTPGQQHDSTAFVELMQQGKIPRQGTGRPCLRPRRVCGDKAYSSRAIRSYLRKHDIAVTIPRKDNERRRGPFDAQVYRQRNVIERLINRFKQSRRIATRYEKRGFNYHAMWLVAAILLWLKRLEGGFANTP
jgi:transposase